MVAMNCNECNSPMTELDPREITDPQPSRYIPRWRCDEKECPAQGEVVESVNPAPRPRPAPDATTVAEGRGKK